MTETPESKVQADPTTPVNVVFVGYPSDVYRIRIYFDLDHSIYQDRFHGPSFADPFYFPDHTYTTRVVLYGNQNGIQSELAYFDILQSPGPGWSTYQMGGQSSSGTYYAISVNPKANAIVIMDTNLAM